MSYRMRSFTTRDEPVVTVEELFEREEKPTQITLPDGRVAYRDLAAELSAVPTHPGNWPMHSDFAGVHPNQRKQAYEHSVKHGVPTEFDETGAAIFRSQEHRKKYLRVAGLYDRNASYGDPEPINR